jgi:hypothetical protein
MGGFFSRVEWSGNNVSWHLGCFFSTGSGRSGFVGKIAKSPFISIQAKQGTDRSANMSNRYFNITPGEDKNAPSVINTHQSAITFAGAPAIVTIVVKVLGAAVPPLEGSKLLLLGLSLVVGLLIYWNTAPTRQTRKDKVLGVVFALINSFAIAAAALGIDTAT